MAQHILLLPGLLCTPHVFHHVAARLTALGHRATCCSTAVSEGMFDVAASLLASAPPRFAVAGFSYGGYVALEMVRQAPHRITHLGLLSSQARADSPQQRERRQRLIELAKAEGGLYGVLSEHLPKLLHPTHLPAGWKERLAQSVKSGPLHPSPEWAIFDAVVAMAHKVGVGGFEKQQRAIMSRTDTRETARSLARSGVPILTLFGREDDIIPLRSHMQLFEDLVTHSSAAPAGNGAAAGADTTLPHGPEVKRTQSGGVSVRSRHHSNVLLHELAPNVGHMTPLEQPDAVGDALAELLRRPSPIVGPGVS